MIRALNLFGRNATLAILTVTAYSTHAQQLQPPQQPAPSQQPQAVQQQPVQRPGEDEYVETIKYWLETSGTDTQNNGLVDYIEAISLLGDEFNNFMATNIQMVNISLNGAYRHHQNFDYIYQMVLPSVQHIMAGNGKGYSHPTWEDYGQSPGDVVLPNFQTIQNLTTAMVLITKYHESNGNLDNAISGYINLLYFLNRLSCEGNCAIISKLVSCEGQVLAYEQLSEFMRRNSLSVEQFNMLSGFLKNLENEELDSIACIENEFDKFAWIYLDNLLSNITIAPGKIGMMQMERHDEEAEKIADMLDLTLASYKTSFESWMNLDPANFEGEIAELANREDINLNGIVEPMKEYRVRFDLAKAKRRLVMTQAALYGYFKEHAEYPESFTDLSLGNLTTDPFCSEPLHYTKSGTGALLYSLGPDMKDDEAANEYNTQAGFMTTGDISIRLSPRNF